MEDGYNLSEFLQCAMSNCPITLVEGNINNVTKEITCVNEIDVGNRKFTCWDIQNGGLVLYIND